MSVDTGYIVLKQLDSAFPLLYRFADLKGRGCKVPQEVLLKLLEGLQVKYEYSFCHKILLW
jgi:hypothetical protein